MKGAQTYLMAIFVHFCTIIFQNEISIRVCVNSVIIVTMLLVEINDLEEKGTL